MKIFLNNGAWLLLAALFTYAVSAKLSDWQKYQANIATSPFFSGLPALVTLSIATVAITVELIAIGLLLSQRIRVVGFYLSFFLMTSFTVYLIVLATLYSYVPCACGGILGGMSYPVHIAFNIFFTLVAVVGIYTSTDDTNEHSAPHTA